MQTKVFVHSVRVQANVRLPFRFPFDVRPGHSVQSVGLIATRSWNLTVSIVVVGTEADGRCCLSSGCEPGLSWAREEIYYGSVSGAPEGREETMHVGKRDVQASASLALRTPGADRLRGLQFTPYRVMLK